MTDVIDKTIHRHIHHEAKCYKVFRVAVTSCEANEVTVRHATALLKTERFDRLTDDDQFVFPWISTSIRYQD